MKARSVWWSGGEEGRGRIWRERTRVVVDGQVKAKVLSASTSISQLLGFCLAGFGAWNRFQGAD